MSRAKDFRDMPLFVPGSETSRAAAESMVEAAGTLRSKVRIYIVTEGYDGATDDEVEVALGLKSNTARPRRHELMERSLVMDSGRTRKTRSGRDATVWIAAPEGHKYKDMKLLHKLERKVIEAAKAWKRGWLYPLNPSSDQGDWKLWEALEALDNERIHKGERP